MVGKGLDRKQSGRLGAQHTAVDHTLRVHILLSSDEANKNGSICNESCFTQLEKALQEGRVSSSTFWRYH